MVNLVAKPAVLFAPLANGRQSNVRMFDWIAPLGIWLVARPGSLAAMPPKAVRLSASSNRIGVPAEFCMATAAWVFGVPSGGCLKQWITRAPKQGSANAAFSCPPREGGSCG